MRTIIEFSPFTREASKHLDAEETGNLISFISFNPKKGALITGSGGFRKLRWKKEGTGKSGGVRVVYLYINDEYSIFAIALYGKNEQANLSKAEINELYNIAQAIKGVRNAR